jgi:hypothetical protein
MLGRAVVCGDGRVGLAQPVSGAMVQVRRVAAAAEPVAERAGIFECQARRSELSRASLCGVG